MLVKIIKTYRDVVAICDTEILGKYFEEGDFQLDLKESFYGGDEKTEQEVIEIIQDLQREDATFNIVGEKSIKAAVESGLIEKNSAGTIAGIPFAFVLL
ncbi:MAG: DUF424 family protein [Nanoarchaeota archaeon]